MGVVGESLRWQAVSKPKISDGSKTITVGKVWRLKDKMPIHNHADKFSATAVSRLSKAFGGECGGLPLLVCLRGMTAYFGGEFKVRGVGELSLCSASLGV